MKIALLNPGRLVTYLERPGELVRDADFMVPARFVRQVLSSKQDNLAVTERAMSVYSQQTIKTIAEVRNKISR